MSVSATDVLYAQQDPQALATKIGKNVTANDVFYFKQDPQAVATKVGVSLNADCEAGSYEVASAINSVINSATAE